MQARQRWGDDSARKGVGDERSEGMNEERRVSEEAQKGRRS